MTTVVAPVEPDGGGSVDVGCPVVIVVVAVTVVFEPEPMQPAAVAAAVPARAITRMEECLRIPKPGLSR